MDSLSIHKTIPPLNRTHSLPHSNRPSLRKRTRKRQPRPHLHPHRLVPRPIRPSITQRHRPRLRIRPLPNRPKKSNHPCIKKKTTSPGAKATSSCNPPIAACILPCRKLGADSMMVMKEVTSSLSRIVERTISSRRSGRFSEAKRRRGAPGSASCGPCRWGLSFGSRCCLRLQSLGLLPSRLWDLL